MPIRSPLALALALTAFGAAHGATLTLGALEESQCADPAVVALRPIFVQTATGWDPVSEPGLQALADAGAQWTLALDGKTFGQLSTAGRIAGQALLQPAAATPVPKLGNAQQRFGGWCSAPSRRPLAASTGSASADPDQWKPFIADTAAIAALLPAFRAEAGEQVPRCGGGEVENWAYQAEHLKATPSYRDRQGRRLIGLQVDPALNDCDGPAEQGWVSHWFALDEGTRFIGRELDLVEALDVDSDGSSELLFWQASYNQDGYVLLFNAFKGRSELLWSYH